MAKIFIIYSFTERVSRTPVYGIPGTKIYIRKMESHSFESQQVFLKKIISI